MKQSSFSFDKPIRSPRDRLRAKSIARREDPPSAHEGARAIASVLNKQQGWVLEQVRLHPGRTSLELAQRIGVGDPRRLNRRLPELERKGILCRERGAPCMVTGLRSFRWYPKEGAE